jgi:hypothetical protein
MKEAIPSLAGNEGGERERMRVLREETIFLL